MRPTAAWIGGLALAGIGAGGAAPAAAQQTPGVPTREEVTPPPAAAPPAGPRLAVESDIERAPCPLADPAYADVRVTITRAVFNNLGPVDPAELEPAYRALLGPDRPVATVCEIRDAAATVLRRRGYLAAVQVPTQKIEGGVVTFEVLYARLTAVRVRGDAGASERLLAGYLEPLTREPVFNRFAAERSLLLARDLPGLDVRLSLKPAGTAPGDLVGDVTVTRTPFEIDLNVQNYAARDTGRWGGQARALVYGLTGMGDRTSLSVYSTSDFDEQRIVQLAHDFRVGPRGLSFTGRVTHAWTRPDVVADSELSARTLFATVEAGYPLLRSRLANVRGALGLDFVNQTVRFGGAPISRDRLRVAYLRLEGDGAGERGGAYAFAAELRRGLDIFDAGGAAVGPSRADGDRTHTLVRAAATAELPLGGGVAVAVAPRAQYSFDPLYSFEEFSGGTYTVGRGYDPGTIIGDHGAGVAAELRVGRFAVSRRAALSLQPFLFADGALVWNRGVGGDPRRIVSVGGGVRAVAADRFRVDFTLAAPLERAGFLDRRGPVRALLSISTRLSPGAR